MIIHCNFQVDKILQLHLACEQRIGVIIVGPSGSGKSTLWEVRPLFKAKSTQSFCLFLAVTCFFWNSLEILAQDLSCKYPSPAMSINTSRFVCDLFGHQCLNPSLAHVITL